MFGLFEAVFSYDIISPGFAWGYSDLAPSGLFSRKNELQHDHIDNCRNDDAEQRVASP